MIEIENSRTGLPILKNDGVLLNSSYDPIAEAQRWVETQSKKIEDFNIIFLLGIGSAYHCLVMHNKYPNKKIVIIESDKKLIEKTTELFVDLNKIKILHVAEGHDLFKSSEFMQMSREIFCAIRLPSTRFSNKDLFDQIETVLTGRSTYEFGQFCEPRPSLRSKIDFSKIRSSNLISIKDISEAFDHNEEDLSKDRRTLYILQELVK